MIFILLLTLPLYYVFKGIIVKETRVLTIVTIVMVSVNFLILYYSENGWFKTAVLIYLFYSFADYLSLTFFKRSIYNFPLMSRISIISEEAIINYNLFRPIILIPVNVFLFFKKHQMIGFKEQIVVDIKSKDGTKIKINL